MKIHFKWAYFFLSFLFFCSLFFFLGIVGPDYSSYEAVKDLKISKNFFKIREPVSWVTIDLFSNSIEGLRIFSALLISFLITFSIDLFREERVYSVYSLQRKRNTNQTFFFFILIFLAFTPFFLLLSLSALRQGMATIFLILSFVSFYRKKVTISYFYFLFSVLCHNSTLVFFPIFLMHFFKKSILKTFILVFSCIFYFFVSLLIPFQETVDSDNRIIYGVFSILGIFFYTFRNKNFSNLDLSLLFSIILTFPFLLLPSYFDRLSLYAAIFASVLILKRIFLMKPLFLSLLVGFLFAFANISFGIIYILGRMEQL